MGNLYPKRTESEKKACIYELFAVREEKWKEAFKALILKEQDKTVVSIQEIHNKPTWLKSQP